MTFSKKRDYVRLGDQPLRTWRMSADRVNESLTPPLRSIHFIPGSDSQLRVLCSRTPRAYSLMLVSSIPNSLWMGRTSIASPDE